jgi:hypothetical protein
MLHPARATSHEAMNAGRSCGTCHDGKRAFAAADETACPVCHTGRSKPAAPVAAAAQAPPPKIEPIRPPSTGASPAARSARARAFAQSSREVAKAEPTASAQAAPGDVPFSSNPDAPAPVRFRHADHRGGGIRIEDGDHCERCHAGNGGGS